MKKITFTCIVVTVLVMSACNNTTLSADESAETIALLELENEKLRARLDSFKPLMFASKPQTIMGRIQNEDEVDRAYKKYKQPNTPTLFTVNSKSQIKRVDGFVLPVADIDSILYDYSVNPPTRLQIHQLFVFFGQTDEKNKIMIAGAEGEQIDLGEEPHRVRELTVNFRKVYNRYVSCPDHCPEVIFKGNRRPNYFEQEQLK